MSAYTRLLAGTALVLADQPQQRNAGCGGGAGARSAGWCCCDPATDGVLRRQLYIASDAGRRFGHISSNAPACGNVRAVDVPAPPGGVNSPSGVAQDSLQITFTGKPAPNAVAASAGRVVRLVDEQGRRWPAEGRLGRVSALRSSPEARDHADSLLGLSLASACTARPGVGQRVVGGVFCGRNSTAFIVGVSGSSSTRAVTTQVLAAFRPPSTWLTKVYLWAGYTFHTLAECFRPDGEGGLVVDQRVAAVVRKLV
jgi:hypothetical protein